MASTRRPWRCASGTATGAPMKVPALNATAVSPALSGEKCSPACSHSAKARKNPCSPAANASCTPSPAANAGIGEGKVPDPDPDRWQEQLRQVARDQRAASLRHPWLVRVSIGRIPMGPNALRYSERILAILRAGGLPPLLAVQGYLLLIATVNGFTIDETGVDDSADPAASVPLTDPDSRQQAADLARDYIASLPAAQFPNMTALAGEFALADPDEGFNLLIDIFVDGLARRAAQP